VPSGYIIRVSASVALARGSSCRRVGVIFDAVGGRVFAACE
jgi:hypothetical protein